MPSFAASSCYPGNKPYVICLTDGYNATTSRIPSWLGAVDLRHGRYVMLVVTQGTARRFKLRHFPDC